MHCQVQKSYIVCVLCIAKVTCLEFPVRKFARLYVKQNFHDAKSMLKQSSILMLEKAALNENTCMYLDVCMATC